MAKKVTISNDGKSVYLEVFDISECCFEIWEMADETKSSVKVKIPMKSWNKIVKDWKEKKTKGIKDDTL